MLWFRDFWHKYFTFLNTSLPQIVRNAENLCDGMLFSWEQKVKTRMIVAKLLNEVAHQAI